MRTILTIPDMSCGDCAHKISSALHSIEGVQNVHAVDDDALEVTHDQAVSPKTLISKIEEIGYAAEVASTGNAQSNNTPIPQHRRAVHIEQAAVGYALAAFIALSILEFFLFVGLVPSIPDFISRYGWWLLYLNISVSTIGAAAWHLYSFKMPHVSHMAGMMIGMTVGMQSSMMIGAIIGATNGFFIGSVVAVLVGVGAGIIAGRCCGVMGVMEGMMAGLMGGTMGPMISVMMLTDNLLWFMPLFVVVNVVILVGLVHMYLTEVVTKSKTVIRRPMDAVTFVSLAVIASSALIWVMIYGPKSALVGG